HRENPAAHITGVAVIENSILLTWDIFLQDDGESRMREILTELPRRSHDRHSRPTLPRIRFQHDRIMQFMPLHELFRLIDALGNVFACQKSGTRQPRSGIFQFVQDLMLGLAHESAGGDRRVGRCKQRPTSELDSEINDVRNHRRIEQIRRPKLPARPTPHAPDQVASPSNPCACEWPAWLNRVEFQCERHDSNGGTADLLHTEIRAGRSSSFNFYFRWISRIHRARAATEMAHPYASGAEHNFGITQSLHIFPVDAQTERPRSTCVRSLKSSQPAHGTGVRFMARHEACCPTQAFGSLVREARRKPVP